MTWPEAFCYVGVAWAIAWACYKIAYLGVQHQTELMKTNSEVLKELHKPMWTSTKEDK